MSNTTYIRYVVLLTLLFCFTSISLAEYVGGPLTLTNPYDQTDDSGLDHDLIDGLCDHLFSAEAQNDDQDQYNCDMCCFGEACGFSQDETDKACYMCPDLEDCDTHTDVVVSQADVTTTNKNREARVYGVGHFDGGCSGNDLPDMEATVDAWYDSVTDDPNWDRTGRQIDGNVRDGKFCDASLVSFGEDYKYVDNGDAVLIGTHGMDYFNRWRASMRVNESGPGNCCAWQKHMEFGDTDLEFLFLFSCHSLDDNMWSNWEESFAGLHQLTGFHGEAWIGEDSWVDTKGFAEDSFDMAIADAWIDNMYYPQIYGQPAGTAMCPVVMVEGQTPNNCINRLVNERLYYGQTFKDPTNNFFARDFIQYCDPSDENVINGGGEPDCSLNYSSTETIEIPTSSIEQITSAVYLGLPNWGTELLKQPDSPVLWTKDLTLKQVSLAVNDPLPSTPIQKGSQLISQVQMQTFKLDPQRARIRYSAMHRGFNPETSLLTPADEHTAREKTLSLVRTLGIPENEFGQLHVRYRQIAVGPRGDQKSQQILTVETMVFGVREMNGIPVQGSKFVVALTNEGKVARLLASWPDFYLTTRDEKALRSTEDVAAEIISKILERHSEGSAYLSQTVAYVPARVGSNSGFVPGIVVGLRPSGDSGGTPQLFSVSLVQ